MKTAIVGSIVRVALPPLLGAAGALMATLTPVVYEAVCSAGGLGV